jgi:hypothetical protein
MLRSPANALPQKDHYYLMNEYEIMSRAERELGAGILRNLSALLIG